MERDPLSDVLQSVRLTGAGFYLVDCVAPWVAEAPTAIPSTSGYRSLWHCKSSRSTRLHAPSSQEVARRRGPR
jgi:hypothetical protein